MADAYKAICEFLTMGKKVKEKKTFTHKLLLVFFSYINQYMKIKLVAVVKDAP